MKWNGHSTVQIRTVRTNFVRKPETKRLLLRLRRRLKDNIKMDLKCSVIVWTVTVTRSCQHANDPRTFTKSGEYLHYMGCHLSRRAMLNSRHNCSTVNISKLFVAPNKIIKKNSLGVLQQLLIHLRV